MAASEEAVTGVGVLDRAMAWFADRGVTVERVLSDNASAYIAPVARTPCADLGITVKNRPRRPQTNRKIECFRRS